MRTLVSGGMALIAVTYGMARFGYGLFLPRFAAEFAMSPAAAGTIQAGSFLAYCVAAVLAWRMAAAPRTVVLLAGATACLGSLGVALAPTTGVFILGVVVAGAGAGFASPGMVTLIGRNLPTSRQESAQTITNSGSGAGVVAAGLLFLLTAAQWRLGWLLIAVLAAGATAVVLGADRGRPAAGRGISGTGRKPVGAEAPAPRFPLHSTDPAPLRATDVATLRAADLAPLLRPVGAALLAGASSAGIWTFGRTILADSRPEAETYSVAAWMVLGAFGILGGAAGRAVRAWGLRAAWTAFALAMGAGTALLALAPAVMAAAYAAMALFGLGYTALTGVLIVWAVRAVPARAAEGTVVLYVALAVGQALGAAGLGLLHGGGPTAILAAAAVLGALSVLPAQHRSRGRGTGDRKGRSESASVSQPR
jgi:predicted MFS family arabinose efflux permease